MDFREIGLLFIAAGVLLAVVGVVLLTGVLGWFGSLPGDLRIEGGRVKLYVPFASMLVVSLALSLLLALVRRLF